MKRRCELGGKELERHVERAADGSAPLRYICRKCGRAAEEKQQLCKPVKIRRRKQKAQS